MKQLSLRTVGVRHVVTDGKEDFGELPEAHLRTYVAALPGSYQIDTRKGAAEMSTGQAQGQFINAVEARKNRLLASDPQMSELEAFRLASSQVIKENPSLLSRYRADVRKI